MKANDKHINHASSRRPHHLSGMPATAPVDNTVARRLGNRGIQHLPRTHLVQAKLSVSAPDDVYEQEADRVADQVMRMPDPDLSHGSTGVLQQAGTGGSGEPVVQRQASRHQRAAEYIAQLCIDADDSRPLSRDTAVFVRRILPPLSTVYTIICDPGGRARPFTRTHAGLVAMHTGPVHLSTNSTYLVAWIPASELSHQGEVATALAGLGPDAPYVFRPSRSDARRHRARAVRWQGGGGGASGGLSAADRQLVSVLGEIGMSDISTQVIFASPTVRRETARRLIEALQIVKEIELGARFVICTLDLWNRLRDDRLLGNPEYSRATPERRAEMINEWQRRLSLSVR